MNDHLRTPASPSSAFASGIWSVIAICYGAAVLLGGWQRFSLTTFYVLTTLPDAPLIVGILFIVAGTSALVGQQRLIRPLYVTGMWAMIVLWLALVGCVAYSAIQQPNVGIGPCFIFTGIATHLWVLCRMETRRIER